MREWSDLKRGCRGSYQRQVGQLHQAETPEGMLLVPAATITYKLGASDEFVAYPLAGREITASRGQLS
ncbi:MAG: hypothetical protein MZV63_23290 [Marinilabiliales bacterium]|nr:hypothetical protein [Marinilabiliales bacterium]